MEKLRYSSFEVIDNIHTRDAIKPKVLSKGKLVAGNEDLFNLLDSLRSEKVLDSLSSEMVDQLKLGIQRWQNQRWIFVVLGY